LSYKVEASLKRESGMQPISGSSSSQLGFAYPELFTRPVQTHLPVRD
jgi:hypothetical protein